MHLLGSLLSPDPCSIPLLTASRTYATGKPTLLISILSKLLLLLNEGVGYSWVHPALNATLLSILVGPLSRESWFIFPIPCFTWRMRPPCPCLHLSLFWGHQWVPSACWVMKFHSIDCSLHGRRQCRSPDLSSDSTHGWLAAQEQEWEQQSWRHGHVIIDSPYKTWPMTQDREPNTIAFNAAAWPVPSSYTDTSSLASPEIQRWH